MSKKGKPPQFPSESPPPSTPTGRFLPDIATGTKISTAKRRDKSYVPSSPSLPYLRTASRLQLQNLSRSEISERGDVFKPTSALDIRPSVIHERPVKSASTTLALASPFKHKQESRTPARDPARKVLFPDSGYDSTQSDPPQTVFYPKPPAKPRAESALSRRGVSYVISPIEILKRKAFFDFASAAGLDKKYLKSLIDANSDGLRLSKEFEAFTKDKMSKLYKESSKEVFNGYMTLVGRSIKETESDTLVFALEESDQITFEMFKDLVLQSSREQLSIKSISSKKYIDRIFVFKSKSHIILIQVPDSSIPKSEISISCTAKRGDDEKFNELDEFLITLLTKNARHIAGIKSGELSAINFPFYDSLQENSDFVNSIKENFKKKAKFVATANRILIPDITGKENICSFANSLILFASLRFRDATNGITADGIKFLQNQFSILFFKKITAETIDEIASQIAAEINSVEERGFKHRLAFLASFESYSAKMISFDSEEYQEFCKIKKMINLLELMTKSSDRHSSQALVMIKLLRSIENIESNLELMTLPSGKYYQSSKLIDLDRDDPLFNLIDGFTTKSPTLDELEERALESGIKTQIFYKNLVRFSSRVAEIKTDKESMDLLLKDFEINFDEEIMAKDDSDFFQLFTNASETLLEDPLLEMHIQTTLESSPKDPIPVAINDNLEPFQEDSLAEISQPRSMTQTLRPKDQAIETQVTATSSEPQRPRISPFIPSYGKVTKKDAPTTNILIDPRTLPSKAHVKKDGDSRLGPEHSYKGPTGSGFSPRPIRSATKLANDEGRDNPRKK